MRFSPREKSVLALMSAVHFCLIVDFMVVMPQGPLLMRTLAISARQFGLLVTAYTLGAGLLSLAATFWIDRFDRKRALLGSLAAFGLCNLACAASHGYASLFAARLVTGAFGGVVGTLIFAIVSDAVVPERRGEAVGIVMAAFALASIAGVPLALVISNRWGWAACFSALAAVVAATWLVVLARLPALTAHLAEEVRPRLGALWRGSGRGWALAFMGALILGHFTVIPFLFPSVVSNAGIGEDRLPVIYLVGGLASIVASVAFGRAADRYGRRLVFGVALVGSLAPIFWVTHLAPVPLTWAAASVTSFFVLMGGRLTPATALVTAAVRPQSRGGFLSLVGSVQQLSAALAAFLSGLLVSKADDGRILHFSQAGYLAMGFSLAALLLSFKVPSVEGERAS